MLNYGDNIDILEGVFIMGGRPRNAKKGEFKSGAKQVEIARKGGIASGEAKRAKKTLRQCLEILLEQEITTKDGKTMSGSEAMALKVFQEALKGNLKAWELTRDTAGQKPADTVQSTQTIVDLSKFTTEEIKEMLDDEI